MVEIFYETLKGLEGEIYDRLKPGMLMDLSVIHEVEFDRANICYCRKQDFKMFPRVIIIDITITSRVK